MFKIPNWEDDVPKSKVDFGKTVKTKKKKEVSVESAIKLSNNRPSNNSIKPDQNNSKKQKHCTANYSKSNGLAVVSKGKQFNKFSNNSKIHNNQNDDQANTTMNNTKLNTKKKKPKKKKYIDDSTADNINYKKANGNKLLNSASISASSAKKRKLNNEDDTTQGGSILLESTSKKKKKKEHKNTNINVENVKTSSHAVKVDQKKEKFRQMLQLESNRNKINVSGDKLRQRMLERLKSAQFRFLNEKLYTTSGSEAQKLFQSDPTAFQAYHQGYQQQVKKWPVNPLDLIVKRISKMPKTHVIADMGCGEAALSRRVQQAVRSFDLVAHAPGVEACDMAHTPLPAAAADAVVFCLALMGTDLTQYLLEANRVLKTSGYLLIAEVESRFDNVEKFVEDVQRLGFKLKNLDKSHSVFFFMEFTKVRDPPAKKSKLPMLTLKPCLYKKR